MVGFARAPPSLALNRLDTSLNSDWATAKGWMFALNHRGLLCRAVKADPRLKSCQEEFYQREEGEPDIKYYKSFRA